MNTKYLFSRFLSVVLVLSLGIALMAEVHPSQAVVHAAASGDLAGWSEHAGVVVRNTSSSALPNGYTVSLTLDTAGFISQNRMQADCDDLRLTFNPGTEAEIDRLVSGCNTNATVVQFRTQAQILASASDSRYTLYYGNSTAVNPPQNRANVYAFYDDFQDGNADGWTKKGTWNVVNDAGNYVYRYTTGGANWALANVTLADSTNIDYMAKIRASADTNWIGLAFRIQDNNDFLTFYQSLDSTQFKYARIVADNHFIQLFPGFSMGRNSWYWLRVRALGTTVQSRIWADGTSEPVTWTISTTDSTYQSSSDIGLTLYNHTTIADWDEVQVRRLVDSEPTVEISSPLPTITVTANSGQSKVIGASDPVFTYTYTPSTPPVTFTGALSRVPGENIGSYAITQGTLLASGYNINFVPSDFTIYPRLISTYYYRVPITVTNTSSSATLPVKYTAQLVLDTSALVASGRMLSNCSDLRVGSGQDPSVYEIDRVVENCNTTNTRVWFALQRPISPSAQDTGYYLYYGDPSPQPPLANEMNVFLFFEDWEKGTNHWTGSGGLDSGHTGTMGSSIISNENSVSPANGQKFPNKASGGDAFSGYIPVLPNTTYAIGVWAKSGTSTYAPVGIDPYTATLVKGTENWLWTNEWSIPFDWGWRSAQFTTSATTAFIKIKSEWWAEAPGTEPVYMDNLGLRYAIANEPTLTMGEEETTLVVPVITNIQDNGPVSLGSQVSITAAISTTQGGIDSATLRIISPVSVNVAMSMISGTATDGVWQGSYTPTQGGAFSYRIVAHSTIGTQTTSPIHTFSVTDNTPPSITPLVFTNPILVNDTQTVTVNVTDNGAVSSVSLTVGGATHPMTKNGDQYSYAWKVTTVGEIPFTVTATDSASNQSHLDSSFTSQAREVDICTWSGCRQGAASWSIDDGNNSCRAELENAGIRGTYFYNGTSSPEWFKTYSVAGHEIASHTVGHVCTPPSCFPICTPETLAGITVDPSVVTSYRLNQLEPNIAAIEAATEKPVLSMAWPCGCTDPSRWQAASYYYLGARGYYDWVAELTWLQDVNLSTPVNFWNLNSANSYNQTFIDRAYNEGKWAPITSHGSCTGIDYMGQQNTDGKLWVAPIGDVLKYIQVRNASQLTNYSRVGRTITFDAKHTLSTFTPASITPTPYSFLPIVFDNPVTLKIHILDTDSVLSVKVDGVPVASYTIQTLEGTQYITFDATLNTTRHVEVTLAAPAPDISAVDASTPVELGANAQVTATVIPAEGTTLQSVTLRVLSPETIDYPMSLLAGNQYATTFTPAQLGTYTYRVRATNTESASIQTNIANLMVVDTTPPTYQTQVQGADHISKNEQINLSVEGKDLGGFTRAILSTNESGTWQDFDWPISDWWDHNWMYRRSITLTESAGLARTAELINLTVDSATYAGLTSCAELRVIDTSKVEKPVQISGSLPTCHVLFQADVPANSTRVFYVYYGNPAATAPSYTTDLTAVTSGNLRTIQNAYFDLDLDVAAGILSRVRLPQGSNTNLPLSTSANSYWGLHQVCSSPGDGNITGKNTLCGGGTAQASGLTVAETLSGALVREYTITSVKTNATYTIVFRFIANSPYYQYTLTRTGDATSVMNNFWYANGNFGRLGYGNSGATLAYNIYDFGSDHLRFVSPMAVEATSIDGQDNDGSDLGGNDYRYPSATGLNLYVTTGSDQTAAQAVVTRLLAPVAVSAPGTLENVPAHKYGSPFEQPPGTNWTSVSFTWQDPNLNNVWISWRVKLCDLTGNCTYTSTRSFAIGSPTDLGISSFTGSAQTVPGWVFGLAGVGVLGAAVLGRKRLLRRRAG